MKRLLVLMFAIYTLTACKDNNSVIEGLLPSDIYDNEWVYLVPIKGASASTVDSAIISGNTFHLAPSEQNCNKIAIVRVKPQLRIGLQDIIVFVESGIIQVKLDTVSHASGTPLNEVLQKWKDKRAETEITKLSDEYNAYIYQLVLANKDNEVGKFIYSLHKSLFTDEQIQQ